MPLRIHRGRLGQARQSATPRHVLAMHGAGLLSARDGVPLRRYLAVGVIAAVDGSGAEDGRASAGEAAAHCAWGGDHRLLDWANPTEAREEFPHRERIWTNGPDARFRYRVDGTVYDLLLE